MVMIQDIVCYINTGVCKGSIIYFKKVDNNKQIIIECLKIEQTKK